MAALRTARRGVTRFRTTEMHLSEHLGKSRNPLDPSLRYTPCFAGVAELADAADSKSAAL